MKKTITENLYDNCPNCGAPINADFKLCPYCGTTIIKSRSYSESDNVEINHIGTQNIYVMQDDEYDINDSRKVDITSKADPNYTNGIVLGIAVLFLLIWTGGTMLMGLYSVGGRFLFSFVPLGMSLIGIAMMVYLITSNTRYRRTMTGAPRYTATVIGHSKTIEHSGSGEDYRANSVCYVKVLANIDGREQCILIKSKDATADAKYPKGCRVTIAGRDNYFLIVE